MSGFLNVAITHQAYYAVPHIYDLQLGEQPTQDILAGGYKAKEKNKRTESANQLSRFQSFINDVKLPMSNFLQPTI